VLARCLDSPRREEVAAITDLEQLLERQLTDSAAAWPTVPLDPPLSRHLADKLGERGAEPAEQVIRTMPAADLYLAAACAARPRRDRRVPRRDPAGDPARAG
jgi:hypothetical protein